MNIKHRINMWAAMAALLVLAVVACFVPSIIHTMGFQFGVAGAAGHLLGAGVNKMGWVHGAALAGVG